MSQSGANVHYIPALEDLKNAAKRFEHESRSALAVAEQEIRATEEFLRERWAYWSGEVERRQIILNQAMAALAVCRSSGYVDSETGVYYPPICTSEEQAVQSAQIQLQEAQAQFESVKHWSRIVEQETTVYRDQVAQLTRILSTILPTASAFLVDKVRLLRTF